MIPCIYDMIYFEHLYMNNVFVTLHMYMWTAF